MKAYWRCTDYDKMVFNVHLLFYGAHMQSIHMQLATFGQFSTINKTIPVAWNTKIKKNNHPTNVQSTSFIK